MSRITDRDAQALEFLREWFIDNRVGPTCQELAAHLDVSKSTAVLTFRRLAEAGHISHRPHAASRALRVVLLDKAPA